MRRLFQIVAWLLLIAISLLSLVPPWLRPVTDAPHNIEHFGIFLLTSFAFGIGYPRRYLFQSIALIGFAGLIEIAQYWAPGRHARLSDFIVDALAVCVGIALAWLIDRLVSDMIWAHDHEA
jgi:VanZ family protein